LNDYIAKNPNDIGKAWDDYISNIVKNADNTGNTDNTGQDGIFGIYNPWLYGPPGDNSQQDEE
jgi:hypothetical protein